ncbi:MAG: hypothetical protein ACRDJE_27690, partial [Dehalococcoidia bacterium]
RKDMVEMMRKCLDRHLLAAFGVVLGGLAVLAPNLLWAALPLVLVAACPLMLLTMGVGGVAMAHRKASADGRGAPTECSPAAETRGGRDGGR